MLPGDTVYWEAVERDNNRQYVLDGTLVPETQASEVRAQRPWGGSTPLSGGRVLGGGAQFV